MVHKVQIFLNFQKIYKKYPKIKVKFNGVEKNYIFLKKKGKMDSLYKMWIRYINVRYKIKFSNFDQ